MATPTELKAGETVAFAGRYLTVTIQPANNTTYERVYSRDGVSVICVPESGCVRFICERDWNSGTPMVKLVSGYLEDGEDPLVCAKRELEEELGLKAKGWKLLHQAKYEGAIMKSQYFFVAHDFEQGKQHLDDDEQVLGSVDLSHEEVRQHVRDGAFGFTEAALALLLHMGG